MEKLILATIGPSSLNEKVIKKLTNLGVFLFRINLSHTKIENLESVIQKIQKWSNIPICLFFLSINFLLIGKLSYGLILIVGPSFF